MKHIGEINNYHGGLWVKEENGKFLWSIQNVNWNEKDWDEIPAFLYQALVKYENERKD
jgi:Zn-finger protein